MHAIMQYEFGGPEQLRWETVPDPHPGEAQVRINVQAAGVHVLDTVIRRGAGGARVRPELPMIPGREVAGVVDELGPGVSANLLGRRVVVDLGLGSGGYAELVLASADAIHIIPDNLTADQAVAMVGTGRTVMAILDAAELRADDIVLVTAAAGGVGTLLVQAARAAGAEVVGAAGGATKTDVVSEQGGRAVDYCLPDWSSKVRAALDDRPITLTLDGVGGDIGRTALELLGVGGRLVMFGTASGTSTPLTADDIYARGITVSAAVGARIFRMPLRPLERAALEAAAVGRLTPVIGHGFHLSAASDAHIAIESRATVGKTVLHP